MKTLTNKCFQYSNKKTKNAYISKHIYKKKYLFSDYFFRKNFALGFFLQLSYNTLHFDE